MSKLAFISSPLDRNANNRTKPEFIAARRADPATCVVQIAGDATRIENEKLYTRNDAPETEAVYLGEGKNGNAWFARRIEPTESLMPLRALMLAQMISQATLSILAQARSIVHWHESHGYCAKCGAKTVMADAGYRRHCEQCGADHFPRTDPVVIMAIRHKGKILLGRQASWPQGMYSALAGFMEPGETIEDAVRRETLEEAGIKVGAVQFCANQPWPFPSSLMVGMIGEAETTELKIDPAELETARWFDKSEVEEMLAHQHPDGLIASHPYAIAHHIVKAAIAD
jgi:NAD+ diphosphatase